MTAPLHETPAAFWKRLEEQAEQDRRVRIEAVSIRATGNHRIAQNDEPEPVVAKKGEAS
jgi:hypothetical protein